MPIWPFKKKLQKQDLTPKQLRELVLSSCDDAGQMRAIASLYRSEIAANVEFLSRMPEEIRSADDAVVEVEVQRMIKSAQLLANDCGAPELFQQLTGSLNDASNPFVVFDKWMEKLPERIQRLEFPDLIEDVKGFIEQSQELRGNSARQHEAILNGRLGELLFQSGAVADSLPVYQRAYKLCQDINDFEGEFAYLSCLVEVYRYLDDRKMVLETAQAIRDSQVRHGLPTEEVDAKIRLFEQGEPLCRMVLRLGEKQLELDQVKKIGENETCQFLFVRNCMELDKSTILVQQAYELLSNGNQADALDKFLEAHEVDPRNPNPLYQAAACLMDMGMYAQARDTFEEVDRLAPGWFQCRTGKWIANEIEEGRVAGEQYLMLRLLQDGRDGFGQEEMIGMAEKAVEKFGDFAPFHAELGNILQQNDQPEKAIEVFLNGIEAAKEPDVESRLLVALAGLLPAESPERKSLIERAASLEGSLMAEATIAILRSMDGE